MASISDVKQVAVQPAGNQSVASGAWDKKAVAMAGTAAILAVAVGAYFGGPALSEAIFGAPVSPSWSTTAYSYTAVPAMNLASTAYSWTAVPAMNLASSAASSTVSLVKAYPISGSVTTGALALAVAKKVSTAGLVLGAKATGVGLAIGAMCYTVKKLAF